MDDSRSTRVFRLTLAYDGSAYAGWQIQPDQPTIQAVLENALARITGQPVRVLASGRTDAGVHAQGQVASFRAATALSTEVLCRALNANTPDDIQIWDVRQAASSFHPIRDALAKCYRYTIVDGPDRDVFQRQYVWHIPSRLADRQMAVAGQLLVGKHDFRSFEAAGAPRKDSVRTVSRLTVGRRRGQRVEPLVVEIEADGFLYNMVRNIVGTLVWIGRGRAPPAWIRDVLRAGDRARAGPTAPPEGLCLWRVTYPDSES